MTFSNSNNYNHPTRPGRHVQVVHSNVSNLLPQHKTRIRHVVPRAWLIRPAEGHTKLPCLYLYTYTHTHTHSCCCLTAPCLFVYSLHIFKDTSETATTATATSCDIPVWASALSLSPTLSLFGYVSHKLSSINSCSPPACLPACLID